MTTSQWILSIGLLAWVLLRNLGERPVGRTMFMLPALIVLIAGAVFLRDVPSAGNDVALDLVGVGVGLAFGVLATAVTRFTRRDGRVLVRAGAAFAAVWIVAIGGRVAFAEWATHGGGRAIGEFSMRHEITGAGAWTAAFVLMALAMVVGRMASTGIVAYRKQAAATAASAPTNGYDGAAGQRPVVTPSISLDRALR